ncbi:MAG: RES family NAD+ phosphorylase [Bacteroidetes bacterium]|nr:RES family NAD+ phosphorylase [Bacteroidota bacterium]
MEVFRLQRGKFGDRLSGAGASLKGARWNSPGTELIYISANRSLAMAEVAVHFSYATLPSGFFMLTIFIPDDCSIKIIREPELPPNWNSHPPVLTTRKTGDEFVRSNTHCLLRIPSAVVKGDFNILINPAHPEFHKIKVIKKEEFPFDQRLFRTR